MTYYQRVSTTWRQPWWKRWRFWRKPAVIEVGAGVYELMGLKADVQITPRLPSDDIVARAVAALIGTTPGPWETNVHPMPGHTADEWFVLEIVHPNGEFHPLNVVKVRGARNAAKSCCWPPTQADARFIADARTLIPELISEVNRLRVKGVG